MKINNKEIQKVDYNKLNARQKENYNFAKISGILADYGFSCIRLSDDYKGADFLAIHTSQDLILKVQLKSRLTFAKKYEKMKDLYITFHEKKSDSWYLYLHDELLERVSEKTELKESKSWTDTGIYHFSNIPKQIEGILDEYIISTK
jgi:hypothetical protein